jgi:hypothetical protein
MSRVVQLSLDERTVVAKCAAENVGISAIETLPAGGVRLVCMSSVGAATIRRKLKTHLIDGEVTRELHRPVKPMW